MEKVADARGKTAGFYKSAKDEASRVAFGEFATATATLGDDIEEYAGLVKDIETDWTKEKRALLALKAFLQKTEKSASASRGAGHELPMRMPTTKTSTPPTITWKAACRNGVSI
jgi:hypothetical protein